MPQTVYFTIDSFTSSIEEPPTCDNPSLCNCNEHGTCEHECTCGCQEHGGQCVCAETYNTITIQLPQYFTNALNPNKTVQVLMVRLYDPSTSERIEGSAHSDIVMTSASADYYVCATNLAYPIPKTYVIPTNKPTFNVWFKRVDGSIVDLEPSKTRVIIELLLTF